MKKIQYVAGFCFNYERTKVALVLKNKPDWQKGKYNGIGGKIEENESAVNAMEREFKEETGADVWAWNKFLVYEGEDYVVHFFKAFSKGIDEVNTVTDEEIRVFEINGDLIGQPIIPNLQWLIPLALDKNVIECSASEILKPRTP